METKKNDAYVQIKKMIIEGELEPMADISEEVFKKRLNTSRTPVHEAIQQLEKEGFVRIYPRKGTFVSPITVELIDEVYELRLLNEPALVRNACRVLPKERLLDIQKRFHSPPAACAQNEFNNYYINLDQELHRIILDCSKNRFLKYAMSTAYDHNHRARIKAAAYKKEFDIAINDHCQIIDALLERDEELAVTLIIKHINEGKINMKGFTL